MPLLDSTATSIRSHAEAAYPSESCGLVQVIKGREVYTRCTNRAARGAFEIPPEEYASAEDAGEITHIVHSHPDVPPIPSQADRVGCEESGLPWVIVNWPTGAIHTFEPTGYVAPLVGRQYAYGVLDCCTLARDYYRSELGIDLPMQPEWWAEGDAAINRHFREAGFIQHHGPVQPHDALLFILGGETINHTGIYLGGDMFLHHQLNRLSSRDVYGHAWQRITARVLRHQSLM